MGEGVWLLPPSLPSPATYTHHTAKPKQKRPFSGLGYFTQSKRGQNGKTGCFRMQPSGTQLIIPFMKCCTSNRRPDHQGVGQRKKLLGMGCRKKTTCPGNARALEFIKLTL